jgi:hypothetical protein
MCLASVADAQELALTGHALAGGASFVTSRHTLSYFTASGGIDVRGSSRLGVTTGIGLFLGDVEGAFTYDLGLMLHSSSSLHPQTHDATLSVGFTTLPENTGVHLTFGWNQWATRHRGFRAEAQVMREIGGNRGWLYVGRIGAIF